MYYNVRQGSISPLTRELEAAGSADFTQIQEGYITIGDGENSGSIIVQIKDDNVAEVNEVFLVEIARLQLMSLMTTNFLPVMGKCRGPFYKWTLPVCYAKMFYTGNCNN